MKNILKDRLLLPNRNSKPVSPAKGAVLVIAMRWTDRLIGLVSTLILARFLVPADFGIIAMASIVVGLMDALLDLGVGSALIQNRQAGREEFDTAWTLRMVQCFLAASAIWLSSSFAAEHFRDPRLTDVIRFMALTVLVAGLENIGTVCFQKQLEFGRDFKYLFLRRLSTFVVTIALAFYFRSYWAMVIGSFAGRLVGVALSYILHDYRPRISFAKVRDMWSFSQWILLRNLGAYGLLQLDKFLIGQRTDAATMGAYSIADEISSMPTTEVLAPLGRVLFPVFVTVVHNADKLRSAYCKAIGIQTLFALPAGVGLSLVAQDAVPFLLGNQWISAIPLVQFLALVSVFSALSHSSGYLLLALGKVWLQAVLAWLQLILFASIVVIVFPHAGAEGIAQIRLAMTALNFFIYLAIVFYYVEAIRVKDVCFHTWRPLFATAIMAFALTIMPRPEHIGHMLQFLFIVFSGFIVYVIAILLLWRISGCHDGAETYLFDLLKIKEKIFKLARVQI